MTQLEPSLTARPDGELLATYAGGRGEAAFAELVRRHGPMVVGVCRAVAGGSAEADDAAQAVFLTLAQKARALQQHATVGGWLYRVAWYIAQRAAAAAAVRRRHEQEAARMKEPATQDPPPAEGNMALYTALARLPEKYRVPLVLHHLEGRTEAEVAALLNLKPSAASVRLVRGRQLLRERLAAVPAAGAVLPVVAAPALSAGFVAHTAHLAQTALVGGALPGSAAALSQGALRMLFFSQVKVAAAVATAVMLFGAAVGGTYLALAAPPQTTPTYRAMPSTAPANPTPWTELRGRVVGPGEVPVADLPVSLFVSIPYAGAVSTVREVTTDAAGVFSLRVHPGMDVRLYRVGARPDLFPLAVEGAVPRRFGLPMLKSEGLEAGPVTIRVGSGTAKFAGRAVDAAGRPVAGARVVLAPQGDIPGREEPLANLLRNEAYDEDWAACAATTGADGRWEMALPPSRCRIAQVTPPENSGLTEPPAWAVPLTLFADAGQTSRFPDLVLPPRPEKPAAPKVVDRPARPAAGRLEWRSMHGQVTGPDGQGVANIVLQVVPAAVLTDPAADIVSIRTDAQGRYTLPNIPTGRNVLRVGLPDGLPLLVDRTASALAVSGPWTVVDIPPAALAGEALNLKLIPAAVVRVRVTGRGTFMGLVGCHLAAKYEGGTSTHDMTLQAEEAEAGQVVLRVARSMNRDPKRPLTDLQITLRPLPYGQLPEPGAFGVDLGKNELQSFAARLVPGLSLTGRVLDAHQQPVANALVQATARDSTARLGRISARTDGQGRYRLEHLAPGTFTVDASVDDDRNLCLEESCDVTLQAGKPAADLELRLVAGATVTGRVLHGGQAVPAQMGLTLQELGDFSPESVVLQHATEHQPYRLWRIPAGDYLLSARQTGPAGGGNGSASVKIGIEAGQEITREVMLRGR